MPSKRRCVFGCDTTGVTIHCFPNPRVFQERFRIWVGLAGASVSGLTDMQIYNNKKVCDKHFAAKYKNRNSRLNALAIPHLHISKASTPVESTGSVDVDLLSNSPSVELSEASTPVASTGSVDVDLLSNSPSVKLSEASTPVASTGSVDVDLLSNSPSVKPSEASTPAVSTGSVDVDLLSNSPSVKLSEASTPAVSTGSVDVDLLYNSPSVKLLEATTPSTQKEFYVCDDPVPTTSKPSLASRSRTALPSVRVAFYQNTRKQLRNLRSEICRLRKGGRHFKERLQKAEKLSSKVMLQTLTKKMTLPAKIFTVLQFRECGKKPKGRRFLKEEKVLALSFYKRSPKCYALLSKCFTLPSAKSLKNLLAKIVIKEGVNPIIFKKLASNVKDLPNDEKLCILMFDEMYINPQVHYNEREDKIKGIDSFNKRKIADHALTFMVKTIKNNNKQPVAYYFTNCLNAILLKSAIKEVVHEIHSAGLKVLATVCDQSRVNVSAIESLVADAKRSYLRQGKEWRHDIFIVNGASIIPIFDVPHLIKGIRNNLLNKDVTYVDFNDNNKEKIVKWEYFQNIYEADKIDGELKVLHRFTEEHVYVEKMNKMKVKIATQLLSHSVAVAANHLTRTGKVDHACRQVIPFVKMFDNLFDSLNCHNFCEVDGKMYRAGVKPNSPHHRLWTEAIRFLKNFKFFEKKVDGMSFIMIEKKNIPSVKNFIRTIEGMQAIWKVLNKKYGFNVMLCRNLNQDPIENFFGRIRGVGARNVSPNSICFEGAYKALLLNNFSSSHSIKANCEDDMGAYFQSLDFMMDEKNIVEQVDFPNEEILLNEELLLDTPNVQPTEGAGQRGYVCGWVITKCLKYICKSCKTCKKDFLDHNNIASNALIRAKEYSSDKKLLIYPSIEVTSLFAEIQKITESILKNNVPIKNVRNNIIMFVDMFVTFPFKCVEHKTVVKTFFVSKTINVLIYSWCRIINRILNGKIKYDGNDEMKKYAQEYYNKRKKYGIEK